MRGDVEQRARHDGIDPVADPELPAPRRDDIKLVAVVGGLRVVSFGRVEADLEAAVDKYLGRPPAFRQWQSTGGGQRQRRQLLSISSSPAKMRSGLSPFESLVACARITLRITRVAAP